MEDWQTRLIKERDELSARLDKLEAFFDSKDVYNKISDADRRLLSRQFMAMRNYLEILDQRVKRILEPCNPNGMNRYVRLHIVDAEPMTRGDYKAFRGWELSSNENADDEGYIIYYRKGKPDQYISWCPKLQFDEDSTLIEGSSLDDKIFAIDVATDKLFKNEGV